MSPPNRAIPRTRTFRVVRVPAPLPVWVGVVEGTEEVEAPGTMDHTWVAVIVGGVVMALVLGSVGVDSTGSESVGVDSAGVGLTMTVTMLSEMDVEEGGASSLVWVEGEALSVDVDGT